MKIKIPPSLYSTDAFSPAISPSFLLLKRSIKFLFFLFHHLIVNSNPKLHPVLFFFLPLLPPPPPQPRAKVAKNHKIRVYESSSFTFLLRPLSHPLNFPFSSSLFPFIFLRSKCDFLNVLDAKNFSALYSCSRKAGNYFFFH